jgi:hypothetical protein
MFKRTIKILPVAAADDAGDETSMDEHGDWASKEYF